MHAPSISGCDAAERVLSILVSGAYRKNSLTRMDLARCRPAMLSALRRRTKCELPIQLTVLAFPFKVPNPAKVGTRRLPDFAEFAAIRHFGALKDAVEAAYPPGLEIHILHDGALIADVFGIDPHEVAQYEAYFAELVRMARASNFIRCHGFSTLQKDSGLDPTGSIERLQSEAGQWWQTQRGTAEWRLTFQKTLGMINLREFSATYVARMMDHSRSGHLPPSCQKLERRVHQAIIQYHIKDAIIHEFDPRPHCYPDAIHVTTRDRPGRLSIWMVRRGQSLLPWHGVGCLDDRGRPQVVHAVNILGQSNYRSILIAGEEAPFVYRKSTTSRSAGFE